MSRCFWDGPIRVLVNRCFLEKEISAGATAGNVRLYIIGLEWWTQGREGCTKPIFSGVLPT